MFLDPDPKGRRKSSGASPFFSSQTPVTSPREQTWRVKRNPLGDISPTHQNYQSPLPIDTPQQLQQSNKKKTVRIVDRSPVSTPHKTRTDDKIAAERNQDVGRQPHAAPMSIATNLKPASAPEAGFQAASHVSDTDTDLNDAGLSDATRRGQQQLAFPPDVTLLPTTNTSTHVPEPSRSRRSTSSRFDSSSASEYIDSSFAGSASTRTGRTSDLSTLRSTPDLSEEDHFQDKHFSHQGPTGRLSLEPVQEVVSTGSLESNIQDSTNPSESESSPGVAHHHRRHPGNTETDFLSLPGTPVAQPIHTSDPSAASQDTPDHPQDSSLSLPSRPESNTKPLDYNSGADDRTEFTQAAPSSPNFLAFSSPTSSPQHQFNRASRGQLQATPSSPNFVAFTSPGSSPPQAHASPVRNNVSRIVPSSPNFIAFSSPTSSPRHQLTEASLSQNSLQHGTTSTPNFVAYSSPSITSSPDRSPSRFVHNTASLESITSRLYSSHANHSVTDFTSSNRPLTHQRSSSLDDTLPSLHQPKKRYYDTTKSQSMDLSNDIDYDEIDTLPYPREPFSSHLSTIASQSDRTNSQHLSHFSLGSGVLTIDDASSRYHSSTFSRQSPRRRGSEPLESIPAGYKTPSAPNNSEEDTPAGDMTLGLFRAESAKPEPLFRDRHVTPHGDVTYSGPLPPMPPIPSSSRNSEEHHDTLPELSAPSLRQKRSGYSIRQRSNSTPSGGSLSRRGSQVSYCDSERWSAGSSIFPVWAKNFYGGTAALLSASKISLHNPPTPRQRQRSIKDAARGHGRSWTETSITSRLGTGYTEIEEGSPTSSHFLPSIFRPKTQVINGKTLQGEPIRMVSQKGRKARGDVTSQPDSEAIFAGHALHDVNESSEALPSGHKKWGQLKDGEEQMQAPKPLKRQYSKQKLWDTMSFPRPMTKDRLSEMGIEEVPAPGSEGSADHVETGRRGQRGNTPRLRDNPNRQSTINPWRSPSFVESLDTLFSSRGNRQILLFALGFLCPLFWFVGAFLPLPPRRGKDASEAEKALPTYKQIGNNSEEELGTEPREGEAWEDAGFGRHSAGDARRRWEEERLFLKAKWWRTLNRVMCFVGVGVLAAVIALAVIATRN